MVLMTAESNDDLARIISAWFDANFWQDNQAIIGQSHGRNVTYFIDPNPITKSNSSWVLRHYYRGGLYGKFNRDAFLFHGIETTRAYQELSLLEKMREWNLPVPTPVAARVIRSGLFYRADILIEKIPNADDCFQILRQRALPKETWYDIGATIFRLHHHNVFHSDLNIHNIMLDQHNKVWLIDFDKCGIRDDQATWKLENLERLKRSLTKEKNLNDSFQYHSNDWKALLAGYQKGSLT